MNKISTLFVFSAFRAIRSDLLYAIPRLCLLILVLFAFDTNLFTKNDIEVATKQTPDVTLTPIIKYSIDLNDSSMFYNLYYYPSPTHCSGDIDLVILLLSRANNFAQRQAVRDTWAQTDRLRSFRTSLIFIMSGYPAHFSKPSARKRLRNESVAHNDILVSDLPEAYRTLYLKTAVGLKWMAENCATMFHMKSDDNMLISLEAVHRQLRRIRPNATTIHGLCLPTAKVERHGKWAVNYGDYHFNWFPAYCLGGAQIFTRPALLRIAHSIKSVRPVEIEDVWITGLVAEHANVTRVKAEKGFWTGNKSEPEAWNVGRQLSYHSTNMRPEMMRLWWAKYAAFLKLNATHVMIDRNETDFNSS